MDITHIQPALYSVPVLAYCGKFISHSCNSVVWFHIMSHVMCLLLHDYKKQQSFHFSLGLLLYSPVGKLPIWSPHCFVLTSDLSPVVSVEGAKLPSASMWWWLLGLFSCVLLAVIVIFFLIVGQRYKVFSESCLRPPGPLVADSKLRDARLKRGNVCMGAVLNLVTTWCLVFTPFLFKEWGICKTLLIKTSYLC